MPKDSSSPHLQWAGIVPLILGLILSGCGAPTTAHEPDDRPMVMTTFTVLADLVQTVGGEHVRVESITKIGAEIHGYEPTPSDLVNAQDADLILDNGLGLERWFQRFVQHVDAPRVVLSDGVSPLPITNGRYDGEPNPHAWMSPIAAKVYVDNAVVALSNLDQEHSADFRRNGDRLNAELDALMQDFRTAFTGKDATILATCEGAFSYLARDAGLTEVYLWPVNAEAQGTPRQTQKVIQTVREHNVPAVFCESTVNQEAQKRVAAESGAQLTGPLYVDSLSGPQGPVPSFLALLRHDLTVIKEGLTE
ncbi:metal ABC transporter substrate-binding protein [Arthrobacter roseus]|uniref:metal ABC transporter substrate-binding protein n=1 Tax=Arthrobacter roseus TaxID=136274 RepID=UPI0019668E06|nr:metal ABC transporter substrate-binding protein [Arthrobacter roseus]MBM7849061.1 manganese transport system substrate-binding protein [Arthrobacter roseus]